MCMLELRGFCTRQARKNLFRWAVIARPLPLTSTVVPTILHARKFDCVTNHDGCGAGCRRRAHDQSLTGRRILEHLSYRAALLLNLEAMDVFLWEYTIPYSHCQSRHTHPSSPRLRSPLYMWARPLSNDPHTTLLTYTWHISIDSFFSLFSNP